MKNAQVFIIEMHKVFAVRLSVSAVRKELLVYKNKKMIRWWVKEEDCRKFNTEQFCYLGDMLDSEAGVE